MNKKLIIILVIVTLLVIAIPLTLFVLNQQQDIRSSAAPPPTTFDTAVPTATPAPAITTAPTATPTQAAACTPPATPTNVKMKYPGCVGDQCNYTQASCSWGAVTDAVKYNLTITEVDSGQVTKTDTVTAPTVTYVFPVTQNKTYKCDVAAVNACGAAGTPGSDSLLCAAQGLIPSPTTPPLAASCGTPCTNGTLCSPGMTCVTANNGSKYCSLPEFQAACQASPSATSCCSAPPVAYVPPSPLPTQPIPSPLPPTGITSTSIWLGIGGLAITILGGLIFLF